MREINGSTHFIFLHRRLNAFLRPGTFASLAMRQIGGYSDSLSDFDDDSVWYYDPVGSLSQWQRAGGEMDVEWLRHDDGYFYSDGGDRISEEISVTVSPVEQLVAYGLWLIKEDAPSVGPSPEEGWENVKWNENGITEAQKANHQGECLLMAYQALACVHRLNEPPDMTSDEKAALEAFDFSKIGKRGAERRHAPMNALREHALQLYQPENWSSANEAAHHFSAAIIDYGRTINANLKPQNAQRTIAQWFRGKTSSR